MDEMSIFNAALERTDPAVRAAYLATACGADTALRERIEHLLSAYGRAGSFLDDGPSGDAVRLATTDDSASTLAAQSPDDAKSLPPGARIRYFGDYEILEEIARGGMGVVFRARQRSLDRIVAVKMILVGKLADDVELRRFRREAEAAAKLDHPGIVPVFEVGTYDDQPYFSMAYVDGPSLADPRVCVPRPPREAAEWMRQVANAVEHAHGLGFVHRDLKPGNILLESRTGTLKITDFGLARCIRDNRALTVSGQILGTPGYMAPEQARGDSEPTGPSVDIHALGAVLYFLLTGRPPYQADNPIDTLLLTTKTEPVPPRALNPTAPRDLETICLKCLHKEPSRRYRSAAEFAADIQRWLEGRPIRARPVSLAERAWSWGRRNPLLAAFGTLSLVSVLLLTVVSSVAYLRTARALDESDRRFYSNQLMLASRELDARHRNQALWLLRDTDPHRRGWEWNYLLRRCNPPQVLLRDGAATSRIVWTDGSPAWLASDGTRRMAGVTNSTDGAEGTDSTEGTNSADSWRDAAEAAPQLALSKDHRVALLVDRHDASRARLLDVSSGAVLHEWIVPKERLVNLSLRSDLPANSGGDSGGNSDGNSGGDSQLSHGILVAWADGLNLHWETRDAAGDGPTRAHERPTTRFVGVDTDGQWIAGDVVDGDLVRRVIWHVDSGAELMRLDPEAPLFWGAQCVLQQPHPKRLVLHDATGEYAVDLDQGIEVFGLRDSSARQRFVTLSRVKHDVSRGQPPQSVVHVWGRSPTRRGVLQLERSFALDGALFDVALTRDGRWLAAVVVPLLSSGQVFVWDAESGDLVRTLRPAEQHELRPALVFHNLQFDPGGKDLALRVSTQWQRFFHWVVWPEFLGPSAQRYDLPVASVDGVALSAGGRLASVRNALDGSLHDVALDHATRERTTPDDKRAAAESVAAERAAAERVAAEREELQRDLRQRSPLRFGYGGREKSYVLQAANGVRVVYELPTIVPMMGPLDDGKVELCGAQGQVLARLTGQVGLVSQLAFNHDGTRLVTVAADETTRGRASLFGLGVDWDADEFRQSAEIKLWSVPAGRLLWTARGHAGDVTDVAFSPDGRRLATSSTPRFGAVYPAGEQGEVQIWDAETGQSLFQLSGPSSGFTAVTFSRDGDWLAAAAGSQLWVWDGRKMGTAPSAPDTGTSTMQPTKQTGEERLQSTRAPDQASRTLVSGHYRRE